VSLGSIKSQKASKKAEQARQLQKIRDAAFRNGQRMAARMMAQQEGFEAGMALVSGATKPKKKHKCLW
jgi:hypothetical protein